MGLVAFAQGVGILFRPRVVQRIDPDALVAPGSAEKSRSEFSENSESDLHTYRPNSLRTTSLQIGDPNVLDEF